MNWYPMIAWHASLDHCGDIESRTNLCARLRRCAVRRRRFGASVAVRPLKEFLSSGAVLPTFDMLLFGGTGDLVTRKLLPALYRRYVAGQVSAFPSFGGGAHEPLEGVEYSRQVEASLPQISRQGDLTRLAGGLQRLLSYVQVDATEAGLRGAQDPLEGRDEFIRVFFFSTASNLFSRHLPTICGRRHRDSDIARGAREAAGP